MWVKNFATQEEKKKEVVSNLRANCFSDHRVIFPKMKYKFIKNKNKNPY